MSSTTATPVDSGSARRRRSESADPETDPRRERCPRCASRDTKFCYYNNYNTAQPRHFCKSCRRYWTLGGSLRNVPVGGSSRKRHRTAPQSQPPFPAPQADSGLGPLPLGFPLVLADPLLDARTGFDLGLGLWPHPLLDDEAVADTWRFEAAADCFPAPPSLWKDFGFPPPVDGPGPGPGPERKVH